MIFNRFTEPIRSAEELAAVIGTPSALSLRKELQSLDVHMRRFIAHSPFVTLCTHSVDGRCDSSPRGDAPGFVHVLDEQTLLIPDRTGNKRVDSYRNILETGHVGLLFLVPGVGETLRVNGRAAIIRDEAWLTPLSAQGETSAGRGRRGSRRVLPAMRQGPHPLETLGATRPAGPAQSALRGRDAERSGANARVRHRQNANDAGRGLPESIVLRCGETCVCLNRKPVRGRVRRTVPGGGCGGCSWDRGGICGGVPRPMS